LEASHLVMLLLLWRSNQFIKRVSINFFIKVLIFFRYHMIFKMLVDDERSQIAVLKALHDVWKNHQQV
jgi:hypothetical protein